MSARCAADETKTAADRRLPRSAGRRGHKAAARAHHAAADGLSPADAKMVLDDYTCARAGCPARSRPGPPEVGNVRRGASEEPAAANRGNRNHREPELLRDP